MSVLNKIAYFQERRDEVPNQELARELAQSRNRIDIQEIADNLWNKNIRIQSDCIKVLYEVGYLAPELIAEYADDFLKLLRQRNNRMIWGGMIALSTIARLQAEKIFLHVDEIEKMMDKGSVITRDAGMKMLSRMAACKDEMREKILPYLLGQLSTARAVDAPRYAEFIIDAIAIVDKDDFILILEKWMRATSGGRLARLKKVRKQAEKIS
jgi:hypothetical protein